MNILFRFFIFSPFLFVLFCEKSTEPIQPVYDCNADNNILNIIFSYGVTSKNILNTFECTYTKDMVMDPSITVNLQLTKFELDSILEKMNQVGFFSFPDTFKIIVTSDTVGMVIPCSTYKFYVEVDTIQKTLYWEDYIINPDQEADKLRELINFIIKIIESKKEYQKLPPPRGGYA